MHMMAVELTQVAGMFLGDAFVLVGEKRQLNSEPPSMLGKFLPIMYTSVPPEAGAASGYTSVIIGSVKY